MTVPTESIADIVVLRRYNLAFSFPERAKITKIGMDASHRHRAANAMAKSYMAMDFAFTPTNTASSNARSQTLAAVCNVPRPTGIPATRDTRDSHYERAMPMKADIYYLQHPVALQLDRVTVLSHAHCPVLAVLCRR